MREREPLLAELEDSALVARVSTGDLAALGVLYDRYADLVYSFAMRMLGEPHAAGALLQSTFSQLWQQASRFHPDRAVFDRWLLAMVHTLGIEEARHRRAQRQRAEDSLPGSGEDTEGLVPSLRPGNEPDRWMGTRSRIREALQSLPAEQRRTIELCYFQGYTQEEIARLTGEPLATIKSRLRLSLRRLRAALELDWTGTEGS